MQRATEFSETQTDASINVLEAIKKALTKIKISRRLKRPIFRSRNQAESELLKVDSISHEILFRSRTVFPFDLFPDTVIIDREKFTLVQRFFFFTAKIISVPMRDILSVEVDIGPFFGSLHLTSRYFFTNPQAIKFLWRKDALKLQRLLQGSIIATERGIDCSPLNRIQLETLLENIGQGDVK